MTDCLILEASAEALRKQLEAERDEGWHTGTDHQRLVFRIERLKRFEQYLELAATSASRGVGHERRFQRRV